jgi:hypothetical protein
MGRIACRAEVRFAIKVARRRVGSKAHRVQFEVDGDRLGLGQRAFGDDGNPCTTIFGDKIKLDVFDRERRGGLERFADFAALVAPAVAGQRHRQEHHLTGGDDNGGADRVWFQPIGGAAQFVHALRAPGVIAPDCSQRVPGPETAVRQRQSVRRNLECEGRSHGLGQWSFSHLVTVRDVWQTPKSAKVKP